MARLRQTLGGRSGGPLTHSSYTTRGDTAFFEKNISNPITIDLRVGWGEVNGQSLGTSALGQSFAFGNNFLSYSQLRQALLSDTSSPVYASAFATLPTTDPISGTHSYRVNDAEEKALGLMPGTASITGGDGAIGSYMRCSGTIRF